MFLILFRIDCFCTAGADAGGRAVSLPKDFKEWVGQAAKKAVQGQELKI